MAEQRRTVLISGEVVPMSDAAAYVIADDIVRASNRSAPRPAEDVDARFLPIRNLLEQLENIAGHDRCLAWLVEPNEQLGHRRPLEVLATGDFKAVQAATPTAEEQFPQRD